MLLDGPLVSLTDANCAVCFQTSTWFRNKMLLRLTTVTDMAMARKYILQRGRKLHRYCRREGGVVHSQPDQLVGPFSRTRFGLVRLAR